MSVKSLQGRLPMCDFLLVINTNFAFHTVSNLLQIISQICAFGGNTCLWHTRLGWIPKLRTVKFGSQETRNIALLYGADTLIDDYFVLSHSTRFTDGQTDRQAESRQQLGRTELDAR